MTIFLCFSGGKRYQDNLWVSVSTLGEQLVSECQLLMEEALPRIVQIITCCQVTWVSSCTVSDTFVTTLRDTGFRDRPTCVHSWLTRYVSLGKSLHFCKQEFPHL